MDAILNNVFGVTGTLFDLDMFPKLNVFVPLRSIKPMTIADLDWLTILLRINSSTWLGIPFFHSAFCIVIGKRNVPNAKTEKTTSACLFEFSL